MDHGAFSLPPLSSNQSLFIFPTPPPISQLLSPVPISLPCSCLWGPSHAQLLPISPKHVRKLHWRVTAAHEMWDSKRRVLAFCELARLRFLVQRPESHLVWGFKWNAAKLGQSPSLRWSCSLRQCGQFSVLSQRKYNSFHAFNSFSLFFPAWLVCNQSINHEYNLRNILT